MFPSGILIGVNSLKLSLVVRALKVFFLLPDPPPPLLSAVWIETKIREIKF